MNSRIVLSAILVSCLIFISHKDLKAQQPSNPSAQLTKGSPDRFTGDVWVDYMVNDTINDFLVSKVFFEPKACSNWHSHLSKQIIMAIDGEGFYKEKGKTMKK